MISSLLKCAGVVAIACRHAQRAHTNQMLSSPTSIARSISTSLTQMYSLPTNLTEVVEVTDLSVEVDMNSRCVDESSSTHLQYSMPSFRASASVKIPADTVGEGTKWQLGWIQACKNYSHCQVYRTSAMDLSACGVELVPQLKLGEYEMVNCYNLENFPWHNSSQPSVVELSTESKDEEVTAVTEMTDSPSSKCSWSTPDLKQLKSANLCYISATEMYIAWLVIRCLESEEVQALRTVEWCTHSIMKVDGSQPQGERVIFRPTTIQSEARVVEDNLQIPDHSTLEDEPTTEPPLYVFMNHCPEIGGINQAIIQWKTEN